DINLMVLDDQENKYDVGAKEESNIKENLNIKEESNIKEKANIKEEPIAKEEDQKKMNKPIKRGRSVSPSYKSRNNIKDDYEGLYEVEKGKVIVVNAVDITEMIRKGNLELPTINPILKYHEENSKKD